MPMMMQIGQESMLSPIRHEWYQTICQMQQYLMDLLNNVNCFSDNIGIDFGLEKSAKLTFMKR